MQVFRIIVILSLITPAVFGGELVLVENGKAKATLVLAAKPRQVAKLAAAEFQHYIEKMTGCRLPEATDQAAVEGTRVLIGESRFTRALGYKNEDFVKDESIVKTGPDFLLIIGRDHDSYGPVSYDKGTFYPEYNGSHDTGTVYGVVDFLERECGVRWYMPGEIGEVVPIKKDVIVKKINRRRRPWATNRQMRSPPFPKSFYWWDKANKPRRKDLIDYAAENGMMRWKLRMKSGSEPFYASHATVPFYKIFHKTHPEYFAQGYPINSRSQLCLTNPDVINEFVKIARNYFEQPKEKQWSLWHACGDYFPVSPHDNPNWCQCPRCKAKFGTKTSRAFWNGYASKYVWDFVNEVAREVKKTHPDKWISCYAYWEYFLPPKGLKLESNIAVHFCRPMPCAWNPVLAGKFEKSFTTWSKLAKRIFLYEYFRFPQTSGKFSVFPFFAPHRIARDFSHMKQMGLRGAYNDIAGARTIDGTAFWPNPIMDQINFYVWFKYLDDTDRNIDELLDEFYKLFYGPAGEHIKAFVTKAESLYWDPSHYAALIKKYSEHLDEKTSWEVICPPETLKEFGRIMASAHTAAKTPIQKERVRLFDNGIYQMMKFYSERYFWKRDEIASLEKAQKLPDRWKIMPDPSKKGIAGKWFDIDFNDSSWKEASILKFLEKQGYKDYQHAWYRTDISVPKECVGKKVILRFGAVDETCWLWINGKPAGEFLYNPTLDPGSWRKPLRFDITKFIKPGEKNQITVLVQSLAGAGGIWKASHILYKPNDWNPEWCTIISSP